VLQIGAVLGGEFSYELLSTVHSIPEPNLRQALQSLTDAELLYVRGIAPEATYQFKHALIRDAAYEALLKSRRKELHLTVARTIDERFPSISQTHPESLANHWTEAEEPELAIAAWQEAGVRSGRRLSRSKQHYRAALGLILTCLNQPTRQLRTLTPIVGRSRACAVRGWVQRPV
jgi:predicted ATPase